MDRDIEDGAAVKMRGCCTSVQGDLNSVFGQMSKFFLSLCEDDIFTCRKLSCRRELVRLLSCFPVYALKILYLTCSLLYVLEQFC